MVAIPNTLQSSCDSPGCSNEATRTYSDNKGNVLHLCSRHYYYMVKNSTSGNSDNRFVKNGGDKIGERSDEYWGL